MQKNIRAFTLIELLVVVLIISILTAISLPQYNIAVAKTRSTEALLLLRSLANAEEIYYMENGSYTNNLNFLDIDIPSSQRSSSWGGRNSSKPNQFLYSCGGDVSGPACGAFASSKDLPNFQIRLMMPAKSYSGLQYCEVVSGNKSKVAISVCKSLGKNISNPDHPDTTAWYQIN